MTSDELTALADDPAETATKYFFSERERERDRETEREKERERGSEREREREVSNDVTLLCL